MLNTQITSYLGSGPQETGRERTEESMEELQLGKLGKTAKFCHSNRCTESHVWIEVEQDGVLCSSSGSSCSELLSPFDEERQEKSEIPANPHGKEKRGYFNSKFNNRAPLSLHPPVPMVTDNSSLFLDFKDENPKETKRIVRSLERYRVERNKTDMEKYVFQREGNETKGEKTIKLAREKNTLPEVISKYRLHERGKRQFLPRLNDKVWSPPPSLMDRPINFDKTIPFGKQDTRDPFTTNRSVFAWSACVVPATLVDSPVRRRSPSMTPLKTLSRKRVQNNMEGALRGTGKPAIYSEQTAQVLPRTSAGKPLSTLLYPSHHGH